MPLDEYLRLLDLTARRRADGKRGHTPEAAPPVLQRLGLSADTWCELVENFGRLFQTSPAVRRWWTKCTACGRTVASPRCNHQHVSASPRCVAWTYQGFVGGLYKPDDEQAAGGPQEPESEGRRRPG